MTVREANHLFKRTVRANLYLTTLNLGQPFPHIYTIALMKFPDFIDDIDSGRDPSDDMTKLTLGLANDIWAATAKVLEDHGSVAHRASIDRCLRLGQQAREAGTPALVVDKTLHAISHALGLFTAITGRSCPPIPAWTD